jgi:hypothetical protein
VHRHVQKCSCQEPSAVPVSVHAGGRFRCEGLNNAL